MNLQTAYQQTIIYAAAKHFGQTMTGSKLPYLVHVCNVAMEVLAAHAEAERFDVVFAIQVALLHDTVEDTDTTFEELEERFGKDITTAVRALTKDESLPKNQGVPDSVQRIKPLQKEVWIVKLADRITNLQTPDYNEDNDEIKRYLGESKMILLELGEANAFLGKRLAEKIEEYKKWVR